LFMDLMEDVYKFMYNLGDRWELMDRAFGKALILREYCRFLYSFGLKKRDVMFLDLWDNWVEVLKIMKTMKNKYGKKE
jgi:hypothetical protein